MRCGITQPGGYVSLILSCVEANDFSPLAPMSVKDLIWVNVAQGLKNKAQYEKELQLYKNNVELAETFYFSLCDLRDLLIDTNFYTRAAVRENFKSRLTSFDIKTLTSSRVEKKRKEDEKMAKMTPEERAEYEIQKFLAGEIIS